MAAQPLARGGGARFEENFIMGLPASFGLLLPAFCVAPPGIVGRFEVRGPGIGSRRPGEDRPGPIKNIWFPEDGPN